MKRGIQTLAAFITANAAVTMTACAAVQPHTMQPAAHGATPEREIVGDAARAKIAKQHLVPRDQPLALGAAAPRFDAYPASESAVIVFFRGGW